MIALIGALGCGKSTVAMALARELAERGYESRALAIVVNEAGGVTEIRTPHARVLAMPNGCFTCQDEAALRSELQRLEEEGVQVVIMEGFGGISGHETQAFLSKSRYPFNILGILDDEQHGYNLTLYGSILKTHVEAATAGLVITKCDSNEPTEAVVTFVVEHAAHAAIYPLARGPVTLPSELVDACLRDSTHVSCTHHGCGHHHTHGHEAHVHSHEHDHGHFGSHEHPHDEWRKYAFALRPHVTGQMLQEVFEVPLARGDVRAKGAACDCIFNIPPYGRWAVSETARNEHPYLLLYVRKGARITIASIMELVADIHAGDTRQSYEVMRDDVEDRGLLVPLLVQGMKDTLSSVPVITESGHLVTHPERMQVVKEAARRPQVKAMWFAPVMETCLEYWLRCAQVLSERGDELDTRSRANTERELGVSLAWWAHAFKEQLTNGFYAAVVATQPATLVARGVLCLSSLREDSFWRYWQVMEYLRALNFHPETVADQDLLERAREHLMGMVPQDERTQFA